MKHTPGEWTTQRDATPDYFPQYTVYQEEGGQRVATAFLNEANARLIAAAPDMLAALESVVLAQDAEEHDHPGAPAHGPEICWLCEARAAIAKATGEG